MAVGVGAKMRKLQVFIEKMSYKDAIFHAYHARSEGDFDEYRSFIYTS